MFATVFLIFFLVREAIDTPFNIQVRNISREAADAIHEWRSRNEAARRQRSLFGL